MLRSTLLALLLCGLVPGRAQDEALAESPLDRIFSERGSGEAFEDALRAARQAGVGRQALLEARFLYHVDLQQDAELAALLPEFREQAAVFDLGESKIFALREDWLAVLEYLEAIAALRKDDREGFKEHIKEAFWLSPRQGAAFAPHIDRLRLDDAMARVRVDFSRPLTALDGAQGNLRGTLGGGKALLLHFWSPWSRECEATLPDLAALVAALAKAGIPTATLLGEREPGLIADTRELLAVSGGGTPGAWWLDDPDRPYARELRVQRVPTVILVAPDGRVLFHGHPSDDQLWRELARLAPGLEQPAQPGH